MTYPAASQSILDKEGQSSFTTLEDRMSAI
jgi:hypothetical protein